MAEKINIEIALAGGTKVEDQLTDIGKAGQKAFSGIEQSADGVDKAIASTGEELKNTAKATDQLAEAHRGLTLETAKTAAEIAKLTAETAKVGAEIYQTVTRSNLLLEGLKEVTKHAGLAGRAVSALAEELGVVGLRLGPLGAAIGAAVVVFQQLSKAVADAKGLEDLNHTLQMLAQATGQSFESLQQGEALFQRLGLSAETFRSVIAKVAEQMKDFDIGEEMKKSANNILEAEKAVLEARLAGQQAREGSTALRDEQALLEIKRQLATETNAETEAEKKLADARKNSLPEVINQIKVIQSGFAGLKFDPAVKAETIIKGLAATMKEAGDEGGKASVKLLEFLKNAEKSQAIEIGGKLGFTAEQIDRIQRGSKNIQDIWQQLERNGIKIPDDAAPQYERMRNAAQAAADAQTRLNAALDSSPFASFGAAASTAYDQALASARTFAAVVVEEFNQVIASIGQTIAAIGNLVASLAGIAWDNIRGGAEALWNDMIGWIGNATGKVGEFASSLLGIAWDSVKNAGVAAWEAITGAIQGAINKVMEWLGLGGGVAPQGAPAGQMAGGGLMGGRGTGTSDSNLAWLSRGEHVMPARAVRQPGVLSFLEALRRSGGNLTRVLDGMGRFALGGLVRSQIPAFAGGGLAGSSNVTIQFPGLPAIGGLRASSSVVDELRRAAAMAQVRSGGRKPSRYS